jgi:ABC-type antimicrobial peptide transport system permease subunit
VGLDSVEFVLAVEEAFQTVACVGALGMLGGILPALRAARVDPVKVLSSE